MPIVSALGAMSSRGFGEFAQSSTQAKYIEDYFSTYLYTGNGSSQTINNGIGLADTAAWNTVSSNVSGTYSQAYQNCLKFDSSGNYYVVGGLNNAVNTYISKYSATGVLQWQRRLYKSGSGAINLGGVAVNNSTGDVYVCTTPDLNLTRLILAKYNSSGVLQWQKQIGAGSGYAGGIDLDSSGNICMCSTLGSGSRIYVAKFDSTGSVIWQRYLYNSTSIGRSIKVDSSDNIIIGGRYVDTNTVGVLAKYNSSGTLQWQRSFTQGATSQVYSTVVDSSGNIYAVGDGTSASATYFIILKYNSSGSLQWQKKFVFPQTGAEGYGADVDSSGNLYVCGYGYQSGYYGVVAKIDSSGSLQWQRKFTYPAGDVLINSIAVSSSGDVLANGYVNNSFLFTSKIKSDGTTTSGFASIAMSIGTDTLTNSAVVDSAGIATDASASETISASTLTDDSGSATNSLATQSAVTGAGGLVWVKGRSGATDHALYDTARGATFDLASNTTAAQTTQSTGLTSFLASGFNIGSLAKINTSTAIYASWTWRKTPKFFDVVTYTGNGATQNVAHNLGSVPGLVITKAIGTTSAWAVWHRGNGTTNRTGLDLNAPSSALVNSNLNFAFTSTTFDPAYVYGNSPNVANNTNGVSYIAYLFAHDAGGFGLDGTQSVVSCGEFASGASAGATVSLGWEPQFVLLKKTTGSAQWNMYDVTRGMVTTTGISSGIVLYANLTNAEVSSDSTVVPTATGFVIPNGAVDANSTYIYMAIRRGPMKVPTDATTVFSPNASSASQGTKITTGYTVDSQFIAYRPGDGGNFTVNDRLRGVSTTSTASGVYLRTSSTVAEATANLTSRFWDNTGFQIPDNYSAASSIYYSFQRAPSFMDVVCYTGTGAARTVSHNLAAVPELIIVKSRNNSVLWAVGNISLGTDQYLSLNTTDSANGVSGYWGNSWPTSTAINYNSGGYGGNNASGYTYVAYLFATCPGVSKVGSYTGTGATQTISCGFTGGARYVLIKRTDSTGSWWVWDTARGMVAGTDPRLAYNSTAAETNANWVYTTTGGFQIVTSDATVNANGGSYIYLAIA